MSFNKSELQTIAKTLKPGTDSNSLHFQEVLHQTGGLHSYSHPLAKSLQVQAFVEVQSVAVHSFRSITSDPGLVDGSTAKIVLNAATGTVKF